MRLDSFYLELGQDRIAPIRRGEVPFAFKARRQLELLLQTIFLPHVNNNNKT